ncbi:glycerate kinase [Bacteroides stercorirosoris]|jgi:glycerate kinase|uniref:glycerate kinase family protein n=1 Tax=Bacteroides stercorirosoris TaxID=871324 RepID=UPI0023F8DD5F|nr:glycerate kinase [Bacteroides stercorirosoris]
MKKAVIAIDSFKGCLSSAEAGKAAAEGIRSVYPECEILCLPIADGGEGMLEVLIEATDGQRIHISAHNPLMEWHTACYGILKNGRTACIEMAGISGLPLVPPEKRNPMLTTSYGTGELIRDALERGCRNFIIGIGGSATNDAGLGMLQALGFRFLDKEGKVLRTGCGGVLMEIASIDTNFVHPGLRTSHFTVACDVQNPFCGPEGAAYIFAPQKGADRIMVEALDAGMKNLAEVIFHKTGKDISNHPGAGAAGGMGGSLLAFLNAELKPGIQLMLDTLDFSNKIKGADLIITGEGKADKQTLMGKVPSGILDKARKQKIPVILIAGSVENADDLYRAGFRGVYSINPPSITLEQAMQPEVARANISETVVEICRSF